MTDSPPIEQSLHAGPISLIFEDGSIRYLKVTGREIIRRIYAAVRDKEWRTVPGELRDLRIEQRPDSFAVAFTSVHNAWGIHFVWNGRICGDSAGKITFEFDGEAKSAFERNRIGFCILYPPNAVCGAHCKATYSDNSTGTPIFPAVIAQSQPITGLDNLAKLSFEVSPGAWINTEFEGDIFETEDQRNWIDDSFKTYCTPLSQPLPVRVEIGTRIRQRVVVTTSGATPPPIAEMPSSFTWRETPLPKIGFALPTNPGEPSFLQNSRLQQLAPAHVRVEIRMHDPEWPKRLAGGLRHASALKCKIELSLRLTGCPGEDLRELITTFPEPFQHWAFSSTFARILLSTFGEQSTTRRTWDAFAAFLKNMGLGTREVPIGAGTEYDLYEFNAQRPPSAADVFFWSMNPQTHASDLNSMFETPAGAAQQAASVREYFPSAPIAISPITLRPRFVQLPGETEMESRSDPRQKTNFGAIWTIGMLNALASADSLTFFETIGPLGLMENDQASVYPLYHVFRAVAGATHAYSLSFPGLAIFGVKINGAKRLLLGNFKQQTKFPLPGTGTIRRLTPESLPNPEEFWSQPGTPCSGQIVLQPFEVSFVDLNPS